MGQPSTMARHAVLLAITTLAVTVSNAAVGESPCATSPGCAVTGGRYLVVAPQGWDGRTALPALVFFHGWRESAEYVVTDPVLRRFAERHGVLLVAPHGEGNTWSYPGSPGQHRDEFAFVRALTTDVKARFPVDPARFAALGFSQGASMVWNVACRMPGTFAVFGALAGGFWEPSEKACTDAGVNLIHVHGTNDATVPMVGRPLRGGQFRQGNVIRDWSVWLRENACPVAEPPLQPLNGRDCRVWTGCGRGKALAFCTHEGGHNVHAEDLEAVWAFVERRAVR